MEKLITTMEAAKALGVNHSRVLQFIYQKRLPAKKLGSIWTIKAKDLSKLSGRKTGRPKQKGV